jgi:hypothetical protein
LKTLRETLWKRNQEFANAVVPDEKESEFARQGSFFSYFLGAIENECLHIAQEHMVENGMMKRNTCSLAYDGFTGKLNKGFVPSVVAEECSNLIQERTGFPMKMIDKPIEEKIQVDTLVRCEKMGDALIKPLLKTILGLVRLLHLKEDPCLLVLVIVTMTLMTCLLFFIPKKLKKKQLILANGWRVMVFKHTKQKCITTRTT